MEYGFHGRKARKTPFVSVKNRITRMQFTKNHRNKHQGFWNRVIFSDEAQIKFFGSESDDHVRKKVNEACTPANTLPFAKHRGGSIMIWACMSANGVKTFILSMEIWTNGFIWTY